LAIICTSKRKGVHRHTFFDSAFIMEIRAVQLNRIKQNEIV
jgi:hypothetical protein